MQENIDSAHQKSLSGKVYGDELILECCPFCGKANHCYVNLRKEVFICHHCGEKGSNRRLGMDNLQLQARSHNPETVMPENKLFPETAFIYYEKEGKIIEEVLESPKVGNKRLWQNEVVVHYLTKVRRLQPEIINFFELGLTPKNDLQIPFRDINRLLCGYKFRTLPPKDKFYWRTRGSELPLFNEQLLSPKYNFEEIYITEGELDCMIACQQARPAISSPLGARGWDSAWTALIKQSNANSVYLLYDNDKAGEDGAKKMLNELKTGGIKCQILNPFSRKT